MRMLALAPKQYFVPRQQTRAECGDLRACISKNCSLTVSSCGRLPRTLKLESTQRSHMPSAMVTFNGRITLPTDIRKQLGLKTGDNIDFVEIEKGQFAIRPRTSTVPSVDAGVPAQPYASAANEVSETVQ